jgi:WD40 repeat protein
MAVAVGFFDGWVRVWDTTTGVERTTLRANDGSVTTLAFSPDGRTLASGSFDTVRLQTIRDDDDR